MTRARKRAKIARILEQFQGLKYIAGIKANGKRNLIGAVRDEFGQLKADRQDIADAFADFYGKLYASRVAEVEAPVLAVNTRVKLITTWEITSMLASMANRKSADIKGVVVELLKHGSERILQLIAFVFNDILDPMAEPPEY